jgi:16S rRNA (guanine527-N7)-methyltransferase
VSGPADLPRDLLAHGLAALDEAPSEGPSAAELLDRLEALSVSVAEWTRRVDLSAHATAQDVARRLVLGALALCAAAPPFRSLADLGSGAGFPGLPIAIAHPDRSVTLVESRARRVHFQRSVVRRLGLANVRPRLGRAEELAPEPHDAVVAQATSGDPDRVLSWMLPWVRPGGWLLLPGGASPPAPAQRPEIGGSRVARYREPLEGPERTLWIGWRR